MTLSPPQLHHVVALMAGTRSRSPADAASEAASAARATDANGRGDAPSSRSSRRSDRHSSSRRGASRSRLSAARTVSSASGRARSSRSRSRGCTHSCSDACSSRADDGVDRDRGSRGGSSLGDAHRGGGGTTAKNTATASGASADGTSMDMEDAPSSVLDAASSSTSDRDGDRASRRAPQAGGVPTEAAILSGRDRVALPLTTVARRQPDRRTATAAGDAASSSSAAVGGLPRGHTRGVGINDWDDSGGETPQRLYDGNLVNVADDHWAGRVPLSRSAATPSYDTDADSGGGTPPDGPRPADADGSRSSRSAAEDTSVLGPQRGRQPEDIYDGQGASTASVGWVPAAVPSRAAAADASVSAASATSHDGRGRARARDRPPRSASQPGGADGRRLTLWGAPMAVATAPSDADTHRRGTGGHVHLASVGSAHPTRDATPAAARWRGVPVSTLRPRSVEQRREAVAGAAASAAVAARPLRAASTGAARPGDGDNGGSDAFARGTVPPPPTLPAAAAVAADGRQPRVVAWADDMAIALAAGLLALMATGPSAESLLPPPPVASAAAAAATAASPCGDVWAATLTAAAPAAGPLSADEATSLAAAVAVVVAVAGVAAGRRAAGAPPVLPPRVGGWLVRASWALLAMMALGMGGQAMGGGGRSGPGGGALAADSTECLEWLFGLK